MPIDALRARLRVGRLCSVAALAFACSCDSSPEADPPGLPLTAGAPIGADHDGQYHLGPVDFAETRFHNACAPYPSSLRRITGNMIAGVSDTIAIPGSLCDACIEVTTARGRSEVLRVVTYGASNASGDLDLSPAAFDALTEGEYPRTMSWHLVSCDNGEPLQIQFQTAASEWWTSLWVRNPSMAVVGVEVRSANHPSFTALTLGTDGTYTDPGGFGAGPFTLRVHGATGATLDVDFDSVPAGALVPADGNLAPL